MEPFFIVISSILCALNAEAQVTATISPDEDYNAPLDESSMIRFNCTATVSIIAWLVDGTEVTAGSTLSSKGVSTTPVDTIDGGLSFSSLSIPARKQNDNTSIQCAAIRFNPPISNASKLVLLNVQGLLGPPPNLTLSEPDGNYTRILSWDAPKTLDLTDIDPDILYYTVCYNIGDDVNCTNISSTGEREIKFTFCNVSVTLLFTVTAVNIVGEGNTSSVFYQPLGNRLTMPIDTTTAMPPDLPTTEGVSNRPSVIGTTVEGLIIGVLIAVAALLIVTVIAIVLCWKKKKKSEELKKQSTMHLLESIEVDGGRGNTNILTQNSKAEKDAGGFYETVAAEKKVQPTDSITESTSLQNHHELDTTKQDSPTSPLYTEIMGKDKSKDKGNPIEVNRSPQALRDDVKRSDSNQTGLPMDEQPPEVLDQNFTKEELEQLNLSQNGPATEPTQHLPASNLESSQESLQSSLKAPTPAAAGDPLYAELEHDKNNKKKIIAPDNTGVQYSVIKTDEIPPRLPQKKSRRSENHSSPITAEKQAHTPTTPVGTPILETEMKT